MRQEDSGVPCVAAERGRIVIPLLTLTCPCCHQRCYAGEHETHNANLVIIEHWAPDELGIDGKRRWCWASNHFYDSVAQQLYIGPRGSIDPYIIAQLLAADS